MRGDARYFPIGIVKPQCEQTLVHSQRFLDVMRILHLETSLVFLFRHVRHKELLHQIDTELLEAAAYHTTRLFIRKACVNLVNVDDGDLPPPLEETHRDASEKRADPHHPSF